MPAPRKYPPELRERAITLYRTTRPRPVIAHLADRLGVHREALRGWIRADERSRGAAAPRHPVKTGAVKSVEEHEELLMLRQQNREMEREITELKRANEILRIASAFFARELDPIRR
jgi:transposase-like protein